MQHLEALASHLRCMLLLPAKRMLSLHALSQTPYLMPLFGYLGLHMRAFAPMLVQLLLQLHKLLLVLSAKPHLV
jgi:hypothetical protein